MNFSKQIHAFRRHPNTGSTLLTLNSAFLRRILCTNAVDWIVSRPPGHKSEFDDDDDDGNNDDDDFPIVFDPPPYLTWIPREVINVRRARDPGPYGNRRIVLVFGFVWKIMFFDASAVLRSPARLISLLPCRKSPMNPRRTRSVLTWVVSWPGKRAPKKAPPTTRHGGSGSPSNGRRRDSNVWAEKKNVYYYFYFYFRLHK